MLELVVPMLSQGGTKAGALRPQLPVMPVGDMDRRAHTQEEVGTQAADHLATQVADHLAIQVVDHPAIREGGPLVIPAVALVVTLMTGTITITIVTVDGGTGIMCLKSGDLRVPHVR